MKILLLLCVGCVFAEDLQIWTVFGNTSGIGPFGGDLTDAAPWMEDNSEIDSSLIPLEKIISGNSDLISDDDLKTIDDVLEMTTDVVAVGAAFKPLEKLLGPLAALGSLIVRCFHVGRRSDPVMDKLNSISHQVDMLGRQMRQEFADMKAFISEEHFDADIVQSASTLHKFMQDTISFPGNDSISIFYIEYQRNPPLELGYKLMSALEVPATNPLDQAMKADRLKTAKTFEKWSKTLLNVMFQFLYIETYANGMFNNSTLYGTHRLEFQLNKLNTTIQEWSRQYKNSYWPGVVQQLIYDVQVDNVNESHDQKAQRLRNGLMQILQDDDYIYFAIVYDPLRGYKKYDIGSSEYIHSEHQKCNAAVMRTRKSRNPNWSVYNALEAKTVLKRHRKKKDKNRCLKMLQDADVYNPSATANAFIVGGHPAIYTVGSVQPGRVVNGWGVWWIATY